MTFADKLELLDRMLDHEGVKDFHAYEFMQPKRGEPPVELLWHIVPTARVLQDARDAVGPIHVTNGYRDDAYNRKIGGQPRSLHKEMCAADVSPVKVSVKKLWAFLEAHPWAPWMGLGRYNTFVHLDTRFVIGRKAPARWDNR